MAAREQAVQRARRGAGLRVGRWESPAPAPSGAQVSSTPAFEGYWLGTSGANQTLMTLGFTLRGSGGLEWHLSRAFGLQAGVGYQYTKMFEDIAGGREFKGLQVGGGLTYRFQF